MLLWSLPVSERFWETKTLEEMTREEWESLCDGCARCCIIKLQDEDSDEVFYTNVVCDLLHLLDCKCTNYQNRSTLVPTCLVLNPQLCRDLDWIPETCAYRLLALGQPLPDWHPLVSGDPESVHKAGISVRGKVVHEKTVDPDKLEDHIGYWVG
ncbi:hypothetical protein ADN00_02960 [Ornatilinea apprima]|uniref:Uncharacterized protein n=1 Tax=Ornatilinea apprima TaxID=1134406 RepID=A0A0P6XH25_9CHLR|nr:hypothetical protein ADN00_02960 [Ornatilinea apprima]